MRNKHVAITGGASGIGKLVAIKCLNAGALVSIIDINEKGLEEFKEQDTTGNLRIFKADLSTDEGNDTTINFLKTADRPVNILINNAGYVSGKSFLELSREQIRKTFEINVYSPMFLTRGLIEDMIERDEGMIVNICSASSFLGVPKLSDYAASKAAILNFDESLRLELKDRKSRVKTLAICPFYINTGMFDGVKTRFPALLPILEPDYVANVIYNSLFEDKKRVIMPLFVYSVFLAKILPPKIYDIIFKFFGVNSSMEEFKGRK